MFRCHSTTQKGSPLFVLSYVRSENEIILALLEGSDAAKAKHELGSENEQKMADTGVEVEAVEVFLRDQQKDVMN
jgi:hypothetical protein